MSWVYNIKSTKIDQYKRLSENFTWEITIIDTLMVLTIVISQENLVNKKLNLTTQDS